MWRWTVLSMVLWDILAAQPITEAESIRHTRQDFTECCPCPGTRAFEEMGFTCNLPAVDDCPCRGRSADSDGASSMFMPRVLKPNLEDNGMRSQTPTEDPKPLLHPEVGLASSVLQTLREATDEEYQEAVARDAARNSADSENEEEHESPENFRESKPASSLVTIIIDPDTEAELDAMPEASHVQEERCIEPLGAKHSLHNILPQDRSPLDLTDILNLPKLEKKGLFHSLDLDNGASNIEEKFAVPENEKTLIKPLLKLADIKKNKLNLPDLLSSLGKTDNGMGRVPLKVPELRLSSLLKDVEKPRTSNIFKPQVPKLRFNKNKNVEIDDLNQFDNNPAPSSVEEVTERARSEERPKFDLKSLLSQSDPLNLKNLWKIKDVELIPKKPNKPMIILPKIKLMGNNKATNIEDCDNKPKSIMPQSVSGADGPANTEILDSLPDPTENQPVVMNNFDDTQTNTPNEMKILDSIPNPSESVTINDPDRAKINIVGLDGDSAENKPLATDVAIEQFDDVDQSGTNGNVLQKSADYSEDARDSESDTSNIISQMVQDISDIESEIPSMNTDFRKQETRDYYDEDSSETDESLTDYSDSSLEIAKTLNAADETTTDDQADYSDSSFEIAKTVNAADETTTDDQEVERSAGNNVLENQESTKAISMQDLQDLSDSILNQSQRNEKTSDFKCDEESQESQESTQDPFFQNRDTLDPNIAASKTNYITSPKADEGQEDLLKTSARANDCEEDIQKDHTENVCINKLIAKNAPASDIKDIESNEMQAEASEPIASILAKPTSPLRSSLFDDVVVQPTSLFPESNLFRNPLPDLSDILNINTPLPSLDEISERVANIFKNNQMSTNDDGDVLNDTMESSEDEPEMSLAASTTESRSILPQFKPLEDINLDIFQINPLGRSNSLKSGIPTLNLNTYKTKLAMPKGLGLKPMKLQSSMGKNGGILGATLTFGPGPLNGKKSMPKSNSLLGSSLTNLPSLDEMRDTMRSKAENLLKTPLSRSSDTLRATSETVNTLSDHLKSHTENTMRNIKETLASTLSEPNINNFNVLGDKYARPENFLDMVSTAHEDASDKLKAIHSDFADRLESFHDSIIDQSKQSILRIPAPNSKLRNIKPLSSILQSRRPSAINKGTSKPYKVKLGSGGHRTSNNENIKPYKMSKAASSLRPQSVKVPKLTTVSSRPSVNVPKENNLRLQNSQGLADVTEAPKFSKRPALRNKFKPFGDTKVSIAIATTSRPVLKLRPASTTARPVLGTRGKFTPSRRPLNLGKRPTGDDDSNGFASETKPFKIRAPIAKKLNSPHIGKESAELRQVSEPAAATTKLTSLKQSNAPARGKTSQWRPSSSNLRSSKLTPKARPLKPLDIGKYKTPLRSTLPASNNELLNKLREAVSRFSSSNGKDDLKSVSNVGDADDMHRSASTNDIVAVREPASLKENVNYRCRLVCVKEPIEN